MKLRESRHGHIHVLHFEGEIDLRCAPAMRSLFQAKAASRCPFLLLDLARVEYIDSTGLAVLLEYLRDATLFQGDFGIAGVSDNVRTIFNVVQLHKVIPLFRNLEEAKRAWRNDCVLKGVHNRLFGEREGHALVA